MLRLGVAAAAAGALAAYLCRPALLPDLESLLVQQGFVPNPGFDATFRPGDVIQIAETDGSRGARQLLRPVLFLRRETCFPGRLPTGSTFALPAKAGQRSGALALDASRLLPKLRFGGGGVRTYSLEVENPRVWTFARADLSEQFAPTCVEQFARALESGDLPAWFGTVVEAVMADALVLTVEWQAGVTAGARTELKARARKELPGGGVVTTELDSTEKTVLRVTGPLVLGYRYRPMEPVR